MHNLVCAAKSEKWQISRKSGKKVGKVAKFLIGNDNMYPRFNLKRHLISVVFFKFARLSWGSYSVTTAFLPNLGRYVGDTKEQMV